MKLFQTKFVEKLKTHIFCYVLIFFFVNCAVYVIRWKNIAQWGIPQIIILCMRIACWIPKVTNAHTRCIIQNASLLQQWFHKRAPFSCYTYVSYLVETSLDGIRVLGSCNGSFRFHQNWRPDILNTVIPRLMKIIRSRITFVSRNLR